MKIQRKVQNIVQPAGVLEGAGVHLQRSIPSSDFDQWDPFLLFDDFGSDDPEDFKKGFPWHPHRGIETMTYVLRGLVNHKDSIGNAGSIGAGDAQWMTSGSGIMHEEMPEPLPEGLIGFQLWINMPAVIKMSKPTYRDLRADSIPEIKEDNGVRIKVLAGEVSGVRGPVTDNPVDPLYLDVMLPAGKSITHSIDEASNAFIYLYQGSARFGATDDAEEELVSARRLVTLSEGNELVVTASDQDARYLLIAGKPLGEPVARYGPFVMNTREEIEETLRDLREGTFIKEDPETTPDEGNH
jgi:redox-sensitive bicupin YhaK (pirin superfamily)